MGFYLGLTAFLLLSSFFISTCLRGTAEQKKNRILALNLTVLWLLCALKKETVGMDISGYKLAYELSGVWPWFDYHRVHYEFGYSLICQILSKMGAPFQIFNALYYGLIHWAWYRFLKRYSKQPTLSLLTYLCYQQFVFNLSALRQAGAIALCLLAYIHLKEGKKHRLFGFLGICLLAASFHVSALIFLAVPLILKAEPGPATDLLFAGLCLLAVLLRPYAVVILNSLGSYQTQTAMDLGGNFILLLSVTAFCLYISDFVRKKSAEKQISAELDFSSACMMMYAVLLMLELNGSIILRAASYASCFLTIALPEALSHCDRRSRFLIQMLFSLFLIALFIHDTLIPNQLELIPYRFFWQ